jgi:DNA primase large subunit
MKAEAILFKLRWEEEDKAEQQRFIATLHLDYKNVRWLSSFFLARRHSHQVSAEEKSRFAGDLKDACRIFTDFDRETFFKVPWTRVPELVNSRRVFLSGGMAYVPHKEQFTLVLAEFNARMAKALEITARALPRLDEDDRLIPVLEHLSMGFLAGVTSQYTSKPEDGGEQVTADMVDDLARRHFPACMRNLHDTLRAKKHLKHYGRLQYSLFLKVRVVITVLCVIETFRRALACQWKRP